MAVAQIMHVEESSASLRCGPRRLSGCSGRFKVNTWRGAVERVLGVDRMARDRILGGIRVCVGVLRVAGFVMLVQGVLGACWVLQDL